MVDGEPVLETVRSAGVLGHVAADRADLLRRRIGRVVVAVGGDRLRHVEVRHPRLHDHLSALDVDGEDAVQPRERDHDPLRHRQRAPGEPGAGAAGDERDAELVAGADGRLDVRGRLGEHDERGNDAAPRQPVAFVRAELLRLANELVVTERRLEGGLESRIEHHGRRYRGSASRWWTSAAARTPLGRAPSIGPCSPALCSPANASGPPATNFERSGPIRKPPSVRPRRGRAAGAGWHEHARRGGRTRKARERAVPRHGARAPRPRAPVLLRLDPDRGRVLVPSLAGAAPGRHAQPGRRT